MARFKNYSYEQTKMIPISYERQILPGSFEYALDHIIEHEIDLSVFNDRYRNDETGAPAFNPAILLKIILYAYSRGIMQSRKIESCCRENVIFMALSADTHPHFTTIADFISSMGKEITVLFKEVLLICDEMKLIGREMFAVDGCKLPSNASKEWSGTRKDFEKKQMKFERAISYMVERHNSSDAKEAADGAIEETNEKHINALRAKAEKVRKWLSENKNDRLGHTGKPIQSNMTDNESAKMPSAHGVIQGYTGVATVDAKHQVVVQAEAFGSGQEHDLLQPAIEGTKENLLAIDKTKDNVFEDTKLLADSGYHSEDNMKMLSEQNIDAYVADNLFRKRDPRFATADRYRKRLHVRPQVTGKVSGVFTPSDFIYDKEHGTCVCPGGHALHKQGERTNIRGYTTAVRFKSRAKDCASCSLRKQCLRNAKTKFRQVYFIDKGTRKIKESFTKKMIEKIDSITGRFFYSRRMGIVEPVFGNIRATRGLNRFTLRGKTKVNIQWMLYCIVHNIGKIHAYGMA
jgi:transposase